jgi:hypothetical protein
MAIALATKCYGDDGNLTLSLKGFDEGIDGS